MALFLPLHAFLKHVFITKTNLKEKIKFDYNINLIYKQASLV